eukprot:NODE_3362_length_1234_cov_74.738974_g3191_i0.p1 GENE.NODE_3362_length_1234_cov_74.738974_g3191_i0~~NODE_3362_length_1234_cov_74.738974_g3191_i0.p1  ORF type:complete len:311 (+),score=42.38 NODE_3362_length_1234_cov_74.738974_g3191_i0:76-1008(+)
MSEYRFQRLNATHQETYDWRGDQDAYEASYYTREFDNGRRHPSEGRNAFQECKETQEWPRGGLRSGYETPAAVTSASIFPKPEPRYDPPAIPNLQQKIASGAPLTTEERMAALYNPGLCQVQGHQTEEAITTRPWTLQDGADQRRLRHQAPRPHVIEEAPQGRRHGYDQPAQRRSHAIQREGTGRRHIESRESDVVEWNKPTRKSVPSSHHDHLNRQLEVGEEVEEVVGHRAGKMLFPERHNLESPPSTKQHSISVRKSERELTPFGTEYSFDRPKTHHGKATGPKEPAQRRTGRYSAARPSDNKDILSW